MADIQLLRLTSSYAAEMLSLMATLAGQQIPQDLLQTKDERELPKGRRRVDDAHTGSVFGTKLACSCVAEDECRADSTALIAG